MPALQTFPVGSSLDGPRYATSAILGQPRWIPTALAQFDTSVYVMEQILRNAGDPGPAGFAYMLSEPQFANDDPSAIAEYGEIPRTSAAIGPLGIAKAIKSGFALVASRENQEDGLDYFITKQLTKGMNSARRWYDRQLYSLLWNAVQADGTTPLIPRVAAAAAWTNATTADPRTDVLHAVRAIKQQTVQGTTPYGMAGGDLYNYTPDMIVLPSSAKVDLQLSKAIQAPYSLTPNENPLLTADVNFAGLRMVDTPMWPDLTVALICESKTLGGWGDRRALGASGWGPDVRNNEALINNITRRSAMFIDEPGAACFITGIA